MQRIQATRLLNQRHWFLIVLVVLSIILYLRRTKKIEDHQTSNIEQNCLLSSDLKYTHESHFHPSMIHWAKPVSLGDWVFNKTGFEFGDPAHAIWGYFGIYDSAASVDVSHYLQDPAKDPGLEEGRPFMWRNLPKGRQYNRDAVDLQAVMSNHYDFICISDTLEHVANPFKALLEWARVVRPGGLMLIIFPYKNVTADKNRDVTKIEHLIDDYRNFVNEADVSHIDEILRLHDISLDTASKGLDDFKAKAQKNFEHRILHHHVYDQKLLYEIYRCLNFEVKIQMTWEFLNLIIGEKR